MILLIYDPSTDNLRNVKINVARDLPTFINDMVASL